jgi:hypothetical protein
MSASYILIGSLEWFAGNGFLILLSLLMWSFLRFHRPHIDLALLIFYVLFNTTLFVFVMGLLGLLERSVMTVVSVLASIIILGLFRKPVVSSIKTIRGILVEFVQTCACHPFFTACFVLSVTLIGLRMLAHVWFLSPYIWDTLSYHLPKVADWIQHEGLVVLPTPERRSFWPANFELFQTWFVVFFHHDFLIEAAGLPFYLLAGVSLYSIGRSLNFPKRWCAFMALLYAMTPAVFMNAVSCKNDVAVAALYLFALALLLDYRVHGGKWEHLVPVVVGILWAVGIKATMVFIAPGLIVLGGWCVMEAESRPIRIGDGKQAFAVMAFLVAASVLLGSYWYVRNDMIFDNPFYPTDFRLFGHLVFGDGHGEGQQGAFRWESIQMSFYDLVHKRIFDSGDYTADLGGMTGWGWFAFSCGLPASLMALIISREFQWLSVGFLLSLVCLFAFVAPDPWNMRFATWFPALLVIGYAMAIRRMGAAVFRGGMIALAGVCLSFNFLGSISTGYTPPREWKDRAAVPVWQRAPLVYGDTAAALGKLSAGEKFIYFTHSNNRIYPYYGPDYSRRAQYLSLRTDRDITEQIREKQARCLLLEADPEWFRLAEKSVAQGHMIQVSPKLFCLTGGLQGSKPAQNTQHLTE